LCPQHRKRKTDDTQKNGRAANKKGKAITKKVSRNDKKAKKYMTHSGPIPGSIDSFGRVTTKNFDGRDFEPGFACVLKRLCDWFYG
jgi:hypothetical protein